MVSENEQKTARTQADKERSRQQSRAVSGKEAAKGVQGKPGQSPRPQSQSANKSSKAASTKTAAKRPPNKDGSARPSRAKAGPRRPSAAMWAWGVIGIVVVLVVVLVIVKITSGSSTNGPVYKAQPVTATIAAQVTKIPESVYNTVGISSPNVAVAPPHKISGQKPLVIDTKPGVFYMGGEFCPYCAAERWGLIASLSRFGTFTGLQTMQSSPTDVYPKTQTFTFVKATYTSKYIGTHLIEFYSNVPKPTGNGYEVLTPLTKAQDTLVVKFDNAKYTGGSSTASGSIPFIDFGNQFLVSGASFRPTTLQSLTRAQIAGGLSDGTNTVTQAIITSANYQSAAICAIDGSKPTNVCSGKGVQEAAKTMGIKV